MSPERFQKRRQATGIALEMLAEGFFKWRPGADLHDSAYPIHLPDISTQEENAENESPTGSPAHSERSTIEMGI